MASLRKRKHSPYWYVRFRDLETGLWKDECLKLRHDSSQDSLKAHRECAKRTAAEQNVAPMSSGNFNSWVPKYLVEHYSNPNSLTRYQIVWMTLSGWMMTKKIFHPREVRYEHASEYLEWRKQKAKHNTARLEIKFLGGLLNEAIRRGFAETNPIALTRIEHEAAKEKKELSTGDIKKIRTALEKKPVWMGVAFEILIHIGCRFNESRIPKDRVNFRAMTIQIEDSKRKPTDRRKLYLLPMTDQLAGYLKSIKWEKGFTIPPLDRVMNQRFNEVLKEASSATSHSCRVSFITRCHRSGLSEHEAMRLVNHSSDEVHRIYSRLNIKDSQEAVKRVQAPPPPVL